MARFKRFTHWHTTYGMCAILSSGEIDENGVREVCIVENECGRKYRVYEDELEYAPMTRHEDGTCLCLEV